MHHWYDLGFFFFFFAAACAQLHPPSRPARWKIDLGRLFSEMKWEKGDAVKPRWQVYTTPNLDRKQRRQTHPRTGVKWIFAVWKGTNTSTTPRPELTLQCLNSKINAKIKLEHIHTVYWVKCHRPQVLDCCFNISTTQNQHTWKQTLVFVNIPGLCSGQCKTCFLITVEMFSSSGCVSVSLPGVASLQFSFVLSYSAAWSNCCKRRSSQFY